jgi:hypothetical protein
MHRHREKAKPSDECLTAVSESEPVIKSRAAPRPGQRILFRH